MGNRRRPKIDLANVRMGCGASTQPAEPEAAAPVRKVVILCTSANSLKNNPTGCWSEEVTGPYYTFKDKGCQVTLASIQGGKVAVDELSLSKDFKTENDTRFETTGDVKLW